MTTIILYLIGRSGSGKYTIAKHIEKYGFKIVDNHLINNPIFSLLDLSDGKSIPAFAKKYTAGIRATVFDFISQEKQHNYVLTNELLEDKTHYFVFNQVQQMAERRNSLFIPIRLHISKEENIRRIQMPERVLRFKSNRIDEEAYSKPLIQVNHANVIDIRIDGLTAQDCSQKIHQLLQQILASTAVTNHIE